MKLLVLGATGGVGIEIVKQAIDQGDEVTAFVRSPERLAGFDGHLVVRLGDLLNTVELEEVLKGQDAVLSGFGPRLPIAKTDNDLLRRFAVAVTGAMGRAGVRRLVVVSTAFLFKDSILPPAYLFGRLFFRNLVIDAAEMEATFRTSGLDWTLVRPPQLTDKPWTGNYRIREGHLPNFGFAVSRADVADFMLKTVKNSGLIGKVVGVSN
jgi:putative NADH-flavin reductase